MAAIAPSPLIEVPLSLFGGTISELSPPDVPEGLSPDNQDVIYKPGSLDWRPCVHGILNSATDAPILYTKSYVQPNDDVLTLFLDANGILWQEDVTNAPGVKTQIGQVPPGLYAQSVSAFGREYLAFSDLLHGQGVPLQYDGTNLDRVTQDGPGAGPAIVNYQPASAAIANPGAPVTINIAASPAGIVFGGLVTQIIPIPDKPPLTIRYYTMLTVTTTIAHGFNPNDAVTLAGTTTTPSVNQSYTIATVPSTTSFTINGYFGYPATNGGGGTATDIATNTSLSRLNNVVTAVTSAAHNFQIGWQVQISGISNADIGGGISAISRDQNGNVTVTTSSAHGLVQSGNIAIDGVSDSSFDGTFPVASVPSPTTFTYTQGGAVASSSGGNVQDIWNVTAFIQSTPSPTTFTYSQIGPDDSSTDSGTATIIGQISPGAHGCVLMFLTRNGALTQPSPPVFFQANGSEQAVLSQIAIGPANVVARVLAFTGAGGDNYFTLTATPQVAGQITGTSFLIPDNTSTSAIIDFADNTLFAGIAIDQIGNDLFAQRVLGPVLGFFAYTSRLAAWGDYAKVENFLNMGFDGGYNYIPEDPSGWQFSGTGHHLGGLITGGAWASGGALQLFTDGTAGTTGPIYSQAAYQDAFGTPILLPNTQYGVRVWLAAASEGLAGDVVIGISSASTGFTMETSITIGGIPVNGQFYTLNFSIPTPASIPSDMILQVFSSLEPGGGAVLVDELEIIYLQNPFNNSLSHWSYPLNPEGIADTTGDLGAEDDPSPIRCFSVQRGNALMTTAQGRYTFQPNDGEPDTWQVNELSKSVGSMSLRGADPGQFGTGDAAEDWDVVADPKGLYLFAGGDHWKVSQEYQVYWDSINLAAQQAVWVKNDPRTRRIYVGIPTGTSTTPNLILVLDYRELDTATQIAGAPPLHITLSGLMKSSDLTRKWTRWNLAMNSGEVLVRPGNDLQFCLSGNFGNFYYLDPAKYTDDDYGAMSPYYVTYGFVNHDQEQQLQLGSGRKFARTMQIFASGIGLLYFIPLVDSLNNPLPMSSVRQLSTNANQATATFADWEWTTNIRGQRIFYRVGTLPFPGTTDVHLSLQKMVVGMSVDSVRRRTSWL